jgi:colanic acid biosynthesis glycosyl transferase WcaI
MAEGRIIFVNRVYWPATEATAQLLTDLAEELAARGREVHVISTGDPAPATHRGVTIHRTSPAALPSGLLALALDHRRFRRDAGRTLESLVRAGDTVVALTDPPLLGMVAAKAIAARGARLVHWIQDIYPEIAITHFGGVAGAVLGRFRAPRDEAWRSAGACVALGADMAALVAGRGVSADRLAVIPNWAPRELDAPPPPAACAERKREWGADGKFAVVYSGNLGRVHEFHTLLEAAELLRDEPAVEFRFIGRGPRFRKVQAAVQARGLARVRCLPPEPRERLAAALGAADAHVVTLEPAYGSLVFPSKLAGALAAGRPVLFVGPPPPADIPRLLAERECGAAFAPGDGRALAATISRWQQDPALARRLGANARAAYEAEFTRQAAMDRWEKLLGKITDNRA